MKALLDIPRFFEQNQSKFQGGGGGNVARDWGGEVKQEQKHNFYTVLSTVLIAGGEIGTTPGESKLLLLVVSVCRGSLP